MKVVFDSSLEEFFKRAFPGLTDYQSRIGFIMFKWEGKEIYFVCDQKGNKINSYGEDSELVDLIIEKQSEIDSLIKK